MEPFSSSQRVSDVIMRASRFDLKRKQKALSCELSDERLAVQMTGGDKVAIAGLYWPDPTFFLLYRLGISDQGESCKSGLCRAGGKRAAGREAVVIKIARRVSCFAYLSRRSPVSIIHMCMSDRLSGYDDTIYNVFLYFILQSYRSSVVCASYHHPTVLPSR